ncbi:tRNA-uridine aminocarboxypropyltransferase 1-like, partial [Stegodyphus dumicola]|uniref:tRNA-uridine aminocarboxypropyltransferase 1-like n=1 Tax=Stegodyphus dumicola TaxID=202533 RepID=UPI0015AA52D0
LPVKIDIIKHPKEVDGKSTAAHAAVLAPKDVKIYTYPDFPFYENEKVLLIFPGKAALPFHEWWIKNFKSNSLSALNESDKNENAGDKPSYNQCLKSSPPVRCGDEEQSILPFSRVVFIDSTWRQSKALYSDPRIRALPCVVLNSHKSVFWRYYRGKHETHLSTVEAIYYFLVELHCLSYPDLPYLGQYDNMLFFFKFMYYKIRTLYDPLKLKAYQESSLCFADITPVSVLAPTERLSRHSPGHC